MPKLHPPFFLMNGDNVRDLLARRHWGQDALAEELGVTRGYACQLLNGKRLLSPKIRRRMLDSELFVGVSEDELWSEVAGLPEPMDVAS